MFYKIAESLVEYDPIYPFLRDKMEPYRHHGEGSADIRLTVTDEYCRMRQEEQRHLTVPQCEYIFVGAEFYRKFILQGGIMIHASAVEVDRKAYLFSASSGTGKSTHTKQWQKLFGEERAVIINDDKPAVRRGEDGWYAYGTPFSGKTDKQVNRKVRMQGLCMLERGTENRIRRMEAGEAIPMLMQQTIVSRKRELAEALLIILDQLFREVPIYRMQCNISQEAAQMAYDEMRGVEDEDKKGIFNARTGR